MICFQPSTDHFWYFRAKVNLLFLWVADRSGFFFLTTAFSWANLRVFLTVWGETGLVMIELMNWGASTALSAFPDTIWWTIALLSVGVSLDRWPNLIFSFYGRAFFKALSTVDLPRPVFEAIWQAEEPKEWRTRMVSCWAEDMGFMTMMNGLASSQLIYIDRDRSNYLIDT